MRLSDESRIKKSFEEVKITTTSEMILSAFEKQKLAPMQMETKTKKRSSLWFSLSIGFSSVALVCSSVAAVTVLLNNPDTTTPIIINDHHLQAAFELYTGVNLLSYVTNTPYSIKPLNVEPLFTSGEETKKPVTLQEFNEVVDKYHQNYELYTSLLTKGSEVQYQITSGTFVGDYGTYQYQMSIEESIHFYYSDGFVEEEGQYLGELHIGETDAYQVDFDIEQNIYTNKKEVEITINLDEDTSFEIEYSTKPNRYSYEYTYVENGEEIKSVEIELRGKGNGLTLDIDVEEENKNFSYKIRKTEENSFRMNYEYENGTDTYSGIINLTIYSNSIIYTETKLQETIIKNIQ